VAGRVVAQLAGSLGRDGEDRDGLPIDERNGEVVTREVPIEPEREPGVLERPCELQRGSPR